ncbi:MAG: hypothetical protein H0V14_11640, partial [Chitinophagaceae bacterium]|nr:hypothetical protein [Chitinophagaceae bacterium]
PNGKKIIFHTGWWHGNNTLLIRLIEDSATIIVLGNKFNRGIYHAKRLANIFQPYFYNYEDDKIEDIKEDILINEPTDSLIDKKLKFGTDQDSLVKPNK